MEMRSREKQASRPTLLWFQQTGYTASAAATAICNQL